MIQPATTDVCLTQLITLFTATTPLKGLEGPYSVRLWRTEYGVLESWFVIIGLIQGLIVIFAYFNSVIFLVSDQVEVCSR